MMDLGIIIKSFITILESKAFVIGATALEAGLVFLLFRHPDNEMYIFSAIVLGVAIVISICSYLYDNYQSKKQIEAKKRYINERREQAEREKQEEELAKAEYVYQRLNNKSQDLLYRISKIAIKSSIEGSYIIKDNYENSQLIFDFENLLNYDYTLADWVEYDDNGDSFCFSIKSPLDKLIGKEKV